MVLEEYAIWILSQMRRVFISLILIVITIGSGWAQAPVMEEQMEEFLAKIKERQKSGMTPEQYGRIPVPKEPVPLAPPRFYVQEPKGRYQIELVDASGKVVPGSL